MITTEITQAPEKLAVDPVLSELGITTAERMTTPGRLRENLPLPPESRELVAISRQEIADIIHSRDSRLMVVLGPCGLSHIPETIEFARQIAQLGAELPNLKIIIRANGEKPRTQGGWAGIATSPTRDGTAQSNEGLQLLRSTYLEIMRESGLPIAAEMLDPQNNAYIRDTLALAWVGSRNTPDDNSRRLVTAMGDLPVGYKNSMDGNLKTSIDCLLTGRMQRQTYVADSNGNLVSVTGAGNGNTITILRGAEEGPNYDLATIQRLSQLQKQNSLPLGCMIDAAHGNCMVDGRKSVLGQVMAMRHVSELISSGAEESLVRGVMMEAMLEEGQTWTDPVMGLETAREMLIMLNAAAGSRR